MGIEVRILYQGALKKQSSGLLKQASYEISHHVNSLLRQESYELSSDLWGDFNEHSDEMMYCYNAFQSDAHKEYTLKRGFLWGDWVFKGVPYDLNVWCRKEKKNSIIGSNSMMDAMSAKHVYSSFRSITHQYFSSPRVDSPLDPFFEICGVDERCREILKDSFSDDLNFSSNPIERKCIHSIMFNPEFICTLEYCLNKVEFPSNSKIIVKQVIDAYTEYFSLNQSLPDSITIVRIVNEQSKDVIEKKYTEKCSQEIDLMFQDVERQTACNQLTDQQKSEILEVLDEKTGLFHSFHVFPRTLIAYIISISLKSTQSIKSTQQGSEGWGSYFFGFSRSRPTMQENLKDVLTRSFDGRSSFIVFCRERLKSKKNKAIDAEYLAFLKNTEPNEESFKEYEDYLKNIEDYPYLLTDLQRMVPSLKHRKELFDIAFGIPLYPILNQVVARWTHSQANKFYEAFSSMMSHDSHKMKVTAKIESEARIYPLLDDHSMQHRPSLQLYLLFLNQINLSDPYDFNEQLIQANHLWLLVCGLSDRVLLKLQRKFTANENIPLTQWQQALEAYEDSGKAPDDEDNLVKTIGAQTQTHQFQLAEDVLDKGFATEEELFDQFMERLKDPITEDECTYIKRSVDYIREYMLGMTAASIPTRELTPEQLKEVLHATRLKLKEELEKRSGQSFEKIKLLKLMGLALMTQAVSNSTSFGFKPNGLQLASVLLSDVMPRSIQEIHTGQGKTCVSVLNMLMGWMEGKSVEYITCNNDLASQSNDLFYNFLKSLDVPCYYLRSASQHPQDFAQDGIRISDINQRMLYSLRHKEDLRELAKTSQFVVDEVDYMLFDMSAYLCKLPLADRRLVHFTDVRELYETVLKILSSHQEKDVPAIKELLKTILIDDKRLQFEFSKADIDKLTQAISGLPDKIFEEWRSAVKKVLRMKEGKDFLIEETKGVLRSEFTARPVRNGEIQLGTTFSNHIQQFLQLRLQKNNQEKIYPFSKLTQVGRFHTIDSFLHHAFTSGKFLGLTGTPGNKLEKDELLKACPGLEFPSLNSFQGGIRKDQRELVENTDQLDAKVLESIKQALGRDQSILLVCENNDAVSREWYRKVKDEMRAYYAVNYWLSDELNLQLYNGAGYSRDGISFEHGRMSEMTQGASLKRSITIGISGKVGRGIDFKPQGEAGLHVIITAPLEERSYIQNIGRSGRQGEKGSSIWFQLKEKTEGIVVSSEERYLIRLLVEAGNEKALDTKWRSFYAEILRLRDTYRKDGFPSETDILKAFKDEYKGIFNTKFHAPEKLTIHYHKWSQEQLKEMIGALHGKNVFNYLLRSHNGSQSPITTEEVRQNEFNKLRILYLKAFKYEKKGTRYQEREAYQDKEYRLNYCKILQHMADKFATSSTEDRGTLSTHLTEFFEKIGSLESRASSLREFSQLLDTIYIDALGEMSKDLQTPKVLQPQALRRVVIVLGGPKKFIKKLCESLADFTYLEVNEAAQYQAMLQHLRGNLDSNTQIFILSGSLMCPAIPVMKDIQRLVNTMPLSFNVFDQIESMPSYADESLNDMVAPDTIVKAHFAHSMRRDSIIRAEFDLVKDLNPDHVASKAARTVDFQSTLQRAKARVSAHPMIIHQNNRLAQDTLACLDSSSIKNTHKRFFLSEFLLKETRDAQIHPVQILAEGASVNQTAEENQKIEVISKKLRCYYAQEFNDDSEQDSGELNANVFDEIKKELFVELQDTQRLPRLVPHNKENGLDQAHNAHDLNCLTNRLTQYCWLLNACSSRQLEERSPEAELLEKYYSFMSEVGSDVLNQIWSREISSVVRDANLLKRVGEKIELLMSELQAAGEADQAFVLGRQKELNSVEDLIFAIVRHKEWNNTQYSYPAFDQQKGNPLYESFLCQLNVNNIKILLTEKMCDLHLKNSSIENQDKELTELREKHLSLKKAIALLDGMSLQRPALSSYRMKLIQETFKEVQEKFYEYAKALNTQYQSKIINQNEDVTGFNFYICLAVVLCLFILGLRAVYIGAPVIILFSIILTLQQIISIGPSAYYSMVREIILSIIIDAKKITVYMINLLNWLSMIRKIAFFGISVFFKTVYRPELLDADQTSFEKARNWCIFAGYVTKDLAYQCLLRFYSTPMYLLNEAWLLTKFIQKQKNNIIKGVLCVLKAAKIRTMDMLKSLKKNLGAVGEALAFGALRSMIAVFRLVFTPFLIITTSIKNRVNQCKAWMHSSGSHPKSHTVTQPAAPPSNKSVGEVNASGSVQHSDNGDSMKRKSFFSRS